MLEGGCQDRGKQEERGLCNIPATPSRDTSGFLSHFNLRRSAVRALARVTRWASLCHDVP